MFLRIDVKDVVWQRIPGFWTGKGEGSAKMTLARHDKGTVMSRSEQEYDLIMWGIIFSH